MNLENISKELPIDKITWDEYFFSIALLVSARSDCTRRQVGCIAVYDHRILSTGYNSPPAGVLSKVQEYKLQNEGEMPPCDFGCCKGKDAPRGSSYDSCNAIHGEENCLSEIGKRNHYPFIDLYIVARDGATGGWFTGEPCIKCSRTIRNYNVRNINYLDSDGEHQIATKDDLKIVV